MCTYRIERDALGEVRVPTTALYGAQTQRAVNNFPISGIRLPVPFIQALGLIKKAAAQVNAAVGLLETKRAQAIAQAADEVAHGGHDVHFPIDVFQTGSGTSTNMNANEVIAQRAMQLWGDNVGETPIHPNDDVNLGQSSNDVIPTAIHVQPGSSIMPGKVNPVICEAVMMAAVQVMGNDLAITLGNQHGNFELNTMLPLIAHNLLQSITLLANALRLLADKAIATMTVDVERMVEAMAKNPILVTALTPVIGYDRATQIAQQAYTEGRLVKEVAAERTTLSAAELEQLLDPRLMVKVGMPP